MFYSLFWSLDPVTIPWSFLIPQNNAQLVIPKFCVSPQRLHKYINLLDLPSCRFWGFPTGGSRTCPLSSFLLTKITWSLMSVIYLCWLTDDDPLIGAWCVSLVVFILSQLQWLPLLGLEGISGTSKRVGRFFFSFSEKIDLVFYKRLFFPVKKILQRACVYGDGLQSGHTTIFSSAALAAPALPFSVYHGVGRLSPRFVSCFVTVLELLHLFRP